MIFRSLALIVIGSQSKTTLRPATRLHTNLSNGGAYYKRTMSFKACGHVVGISNPWLHKSFWSLDRMKDCFIGVAVVNHVDCPFQASKVRAEM